MNNRVKAIRESERKSHIEMYSNEELYNSESWLKKPIKTINDLLPLFDEYESLKVLDLGCGVGRNCLAIARRYKNVDCHIDCVDILELAIEKLYKYADEYGVKNCINGTVKSIEDFSIEKESYDLTIGVSALEHIDTVDSFKAKLMEIKNGTKESGIICFVINSQVKEFNKSTGEEIPAQFEVNLSTVELQKVLNQTYSGWEILKNTVREQQYDIPRESFISDLRTNVVTYVARK